MGERKKQSLLMKNVQPINNRQLTIVKINAFFWSDDAFRYFPYCGSWIQCIPFAIEVSVEGHRGTAGEDHAENDKEKYLN